MALSLCLLPSLLACQPEGAAPAPAAPTSSAEPPMSQDQASPFRNIYDALAAAPADAELEKLRARTSLVTLQGQVAAADYALAEPLATLLSHERAGVRATAADLLGALIANAQGRRSPLPDADRAAAQPQADAAAAALMQVLADPDANVRLSATKALREAKAPGVDQALLARLDDDSALVRFQALSALSERPSADRERVAEAARRLRDDPDDQVRRLAELTAAGSAP
ncbi:MAG TPA: HEAT repeat domain-containing protein [Luteimonas sp.]|nr:HEAT repeat domain-containing protein [Luteimonas sp.]